jgi:E3 ubiquitin-protein ligase UBR7
MDQLEGDQADVILSAQQILDLQNDLEAEAVRRFPGKFDKCTWDLGYLNQPLYVCITCYYRKCGREVHNVPLSLDADTVDHVLPSAVCYSCSISCHADHQLVELFHKRHFRCDCGTKERFPKGTCQLEPNKTTSNEENSYQGSRQNFYGLFCYCHSSYDPEAETGEMLQCVLCEDWFHEDCIELDIPSKELFAEFLCKACSPRLLECLKSSKPCEHLVKDRVFIGSEMFLKDGWQDRMRACIDCRSNESLNNKSTDLCPVPFSVLFEEPKEIFEPEKDDQRHVSIYEAAQKALESMDRVYALEGIYAMNDMMERFKKFLEPFVASGDVVTKEDIMKFFYELYSQKKRRVQK